MDPLGEIVARHAPMPGLPDGCSSTVSDDGTISWSVQADPIMVQNLINDYVKTHTGDIPRERK